MPQAIISPGVHGQENIKVTYERRRFFGFTWYKKAKTESMDIDFVIQTPEKIGIVLINGVE